MKALSVKNPWALLVAHGIKPIENRTWRTDFRGRIYIHASQKPAFTELQSCLTYAQWNDIPEDKQRDMLIGRWPNSAIIGEVDIVDCVLGHPSIWSEQTAVVLRKGIPTEVPVYNWVLETPVLYDRPILNVKGALSLWEYDR